jgi:hypothetical protein
MTTDARVQLLETYLLKKRTLGSPRVQPAWVGWLTGVFWVLGMMPGGAGLLAQELPVGRFLADSIRIGSPVVYSLSYRHSPKEVLIFPDTSYDFKPFELIDKKYFPTRTDASGSLDSVVYTLMSFEIDPVQTLRLPVYIISEKDSTPAFAMPDTVYLREMISGPVDSLSLKANTRYRPLKYETNYSFFLLILLGFLVLFGLLALSFGKQIRTRFRLYRLERRHLAFLQEFRQMGSQLPTGETVLLLEKVVMRWKGYIESLSGKPYSTYTTKEISDSIPDPPLAEALKHVDRTVYGGLPYDPSSDATTALQDFAVRLYEKRRKEISEGEKQKSRHLEVST